MCRKHLIGLIHGVLGAMLISSCVDQNYDLINKDLSTDISIPGNVITLPIGNFKATVLDSIIDMDEIDMLTKGDDNVYSISQKSEIDPIEEVIDPVKFSIDPVIEEMSIEFAKAEITTVHIDATTIDPVEFTTPSVSMDDLNNRLPTLHSNVSKTVSTPVLEQIFTMIESGNVSSSSLPDYVTIDEVVSIDDENVDFAFEYTLPEQIETIKAIKLGEQGTQGALVQVVVTHPTLLLDVNKKIDFEIAFPSMCKLSKVPGINQASEYVISSDGSSISVNDLDVSGEKTYIQFYVNEMNDVDSHVENGVININKQVVYNVSYKVKGDVPITDNIKRDDFAFNVYLDMPLHFQDITGVTKDIDVEFKSTTMDLGGHFDNLQYIDSIYYIEFDETLSRIKFDINESGECIKYFQMKEGYALRVKFPKELTICPIHSEYEGKGETVIYDENDHAFYIYDLQALQAAEWNIALQKLDLNLPVIDEACDMNVHVEISSVDPNKNVIDHIVFAGEEMESMNKVLASLDAGASAHFKMHESDLTIKDAVVHTENIISPLDSRAEFEINEEVPSEIGRIEGIDFTENVIVRLEMSIDGLDELNTDIDLNLHAALPSFFDLTPVPSSNPDLNVTIENGNLAIKAQYHPQTDDKLVIELACSKFNFKTEEFNNIGLVPFDSINGKSYFIYSDEIIVEGEASVHGTEFHSYILDEVDDIKLTFQMSVEEMEVKTVHGIYDGQIDEIHEAIALDLGDELDFLKVVGNTITLAEAQIELLFDNSISIPVDVDLHIYGVDSEGNAIPTSNIQQTISILPAIYDEVTGKVTPCKTKLLLTCSEDLVPMVGYEKVLVPALATLLEQIPDSIYINIKPVIDTEETHHINITEPLTFSGSYSVNIPLKFEKFNISYRDTISDINVDAEDELNNFKNVELSIKMNVVNTIPFGMDLHVTPLDAYGNVLTDIAIDPFSIKPGLGGNINDTEHITAEEVQAVELKMRHNSADISKLDKIEFSVTSNSNSVTGSVGLKGDQGILFTDVVLVVSGDIEME